MFSLSWPGGPVTARTGPRAGTALFLLLRVSFVMSRPTISSLRFGEVEILTHPSPPVPHLVIIDLFLTFASSALGALTLKMVHGEELDHHTQSSPFTLQGFKSSGVHGLECVGSGKGPTVQELRSASWRCCVSVSSLARPPQSGWASHRPHYLNSHPSREKISCLSWLTGNLCTFTSRVLWAAR